MKQQAISTESIKFNQDVNRTFMVYAEFKHYVIMLILKRQIAQGIDYACYESAEAETVIDGSNLWNYWSETPATPKQAFNKFFK